MKKYYPFLGLVVSLLILVSWKTQLVKNAPNSASIIVVGATPSGIMAAIASARLGSDVILLEATDHVGGIVTNGLTIADIVKRNAVGGLFDEYTQRIVSHYENKYGKESEQVKRCKQGLQPEPHVTELVFNQMLKEQPNIKIYFNHRLKSVLKKDNAVVGVVVEDLLKQKQGVQFNGKVFIDATYEGDLAAMAGAKYRVGREARSEFGEPQAGVIYVRFNKNDYLHGSTGEADKAIQAFCFRLSMTREPNNKVPVPKPDTYNRNEYTHYLEDIKAGKLAKMLPSHLINRTKLMQPVQLWQKPNNKVEVNSEHVEPIVGAPRESSDLAEENWAYPEATYEERAKIVKRYWDYQLGIFWFLQNDPEVPEAYRQEAAQWGFCKDEFVSNNNMPRQIYVRETRRIEGVYFLTQKDGDLMPDLSRTRLQPTSIGIAEYPFDSHGCHKYDPNHPFTREGYFYVEHDPFQIPYGVLVPKTVDGLLVPVCLSASHVAYQALRMEPVFMWLGQVAGIAAHQSLVEKKTVRDISISVLQNKLIKEKGVITYLENLTTQDPHFPAYQFMATYGEIKGYQLNPDALLSEQEAANYLKKIATNLGRKWKNPKVATTQTLTPQKLSQWLRTKATEKDKVLTVKTFCNAVYQLWGG
jgi:FAD dependent oxidoreductase